MKEFNEIVKYRSYYEYDFDCEALRVKDGNLHDKAKEVYTDLVHNYCFKDKDKWFFDIALDCVHNFTDEEIDIIRRQGEIFDYHLGYGMYVRNTYVYPSKLHHYFMADHVSGEVAGFIYTILLPVYNCLNENFVKLHGDYDFGSIKEQFGETQPIINEMLEKLEKWDNKITAKEALTTIIATIRSNLGRDGFKETILPLVEHHIAEHQFLNQNWNNLCDKIYSKTRIYRKEYNQLKAIKEMNVFFKISAPYASLETVEDTRDYIMENLGLSEEDSLLMAECAFAMVEIQDKARKENQ